MILKIKTDESGASSNLDTIAIENYHVKQTTLPNNSMGYVLYSDTTVAPPDTYISDSGFFATIANDFTLSFWVYYIDLTYTAYFIDSANEWQFCLQGVDNDIHGSAAFFINHQPVIKATTLVPNKWSHIALTKKNNIYYYFIDGVLQGTYNSIIQISSYFSNTVMYLLSHNSDGFARKTIGSMWDFSIINDKCLWTSNFTPPTNYLSLNDVIYLSGQEVWGINGSGSFAKLNDNYSTMTASEKIAMFGATGGQVPTIAQLKTLTMPIKAVSYNADNTEPTCTVTAVPAPQTVTPKGRISLKNYAKLKGVSITGATSGNGAVKVAATKDNSTYQVYDTTNLAWIDINIADIGTDGMSLSDVAALTATEWDAYDCIDSGIGFAYYLEMTSTSDTAYTDELTLNVELLGELKSIVKGTDYDYSYVGNNVLQVKLYKSGDFRINYNPGES